MVKAVIVDFGRIFIFPKDEGYFGSLNDLHRVLSESPNYNFNEHFVFNDELMDFLKEEKMNKHFDIYLFTKGKIKNAVECQRFLGGFFKEIFSADMPKLKKDEPSTYFTLAEKVDEEPKDLLYIDDSRENTLAAEKAGFQTITFRNNMQLETEFRGYVC